MSKQIALVLAAGLVALSSTTSFAQMPGMQGTEQEQAACRPDVFKHCKPLLTNNGQAPNTFSILACLQSARTKLSKPCLAVLTSHGQ